MSTLRLSHILDKVDDLHAAVAAAEDAGFTVAWGSEPVEAHNALIWFDEGPFIELFAPGRMDAERLEVASPALAERLRAWEDAPRGWCDVALETDDADLAATLARLRVAGVAMVETGRMSRTNQGGSVVSWWGACPEERDLPFVVSAYSERQRPARTVHGNGMARVQQVVVASPDPEAYRERLVSLLGSRATSDGWEVVRGAAFGVLGVRLRRSDGALVELMGGLTQG